jgi:hypothetical protein
MPPALAQWVFNACLQQIRCAEELPGDAYAPKLAANHSEPPGCIRQQPVLKTTTTQRKRR